MFRVVWTQVSLDELANIWLLADPALRKMIGHASHQIEVVLAADPKQVGESRSGQDRVCFEPPLAISYRVYAADRIVRILHVWSIRRRQ